ncbi:unnamed protein product [Adineta steineri]|uniref:Uncharacterized protein n=1 Tax=Adineta steineri TaxID=433720 RepID=A0A819MP57_9BILA|nr:unnamed protein product [Adineta steineri]CAF3982777.1 unnamed protein product [Adineta steineri]
MAFRILAFSIFISMIYFYSIESLPFSDDLPIENSLYPNLIKLPTDVMYPSNFISIICQQQEQYPLKLTNKLCSNSFHLYKIHEQQKQQQRGKRVGWTISV